MKNRIESIVDDLTSEAVLSDVVELYRGMGKEAVESVVDAALGHVYASALSQVALLGISCDNFEECREIFNRVFNVRLLEIRHKLRMITHR
jgi:hypothetical protein